MVYSDYLYDQIEEQFQEALNDAYGSFNIGSGEYQAAEILKEMDPIGYRCALADYVSAWDWNEALNEYMENEDGIMLGLLINFMISQSHGMGEIEQIIYDISELESADEIFASLIENIDSIYAQKISAIIEDAQEAKNVL